MYQSQTVIRREGNRRLIRVNGVEMAEKETLVYVQDLVANGRFDEALNIVSQTTAAIPARRDAHGRKYCAKMHHLAGEALRSLERYEEATECYFQALAYQPQNAWSM